MRPAAFLRPVVLLRTVADRWPSVVAQPSAVFLPRKTASRLVAAARLVMDPQATAFPRLAASSLVVGLR